jgi:cell division protein ZapB
MINDKTNRITDADLKSLENRIDALIKHCQRLKEENRLLLQQQAGLVAERARLKQKTEQARSQTESILTRLKVLEAEA